MTDVSHRSRRPSGRFAPEYRREAEVSLDGPDVLEVLAKQGLEDARFKLEGRQTPPDVLEVLAKQGLEDARFKLEGRQTPPDVLEVLAKQGLEGRQTPPDVLGVLAEQGLEDARFELEGRQTPPGVLGALAEQGLEGAATDDWEFRKQFIGPGPNVGLPVRTAPKAPDTWARRLGHALRGRHSA